MSSGGTTPVTQQTTQTRDPWSAAQPHLTGIMNSADQVYAGVGPYSNGSPGYLPYTGQTLASLDPTLSQSLGLQNYIAGANSLGTPDVLAGMRQATNMIENQGLTPGINSAIGGLNTAAGQYGNLYNQASGQQNPYLQAILDTNNRRIGDRVNSSVSGAGRYGSGAHTDIMTRALAESADPVLAQDYQARQQQMLAATQGLGQTSTSLADLYGQGLQRAGQWAQLAPTLDQAQYAPSERMAAAGQYQQDRSQQQLADQIKLYNAQQAYPWEQLQRYSALIGGAGSLGGTQVTSSPIQQPSTLQSILGGASAGAGIGSIFGAPGAAAGGIGGGLLGLLGR